MTAAPWPRRLPEDAHPSAHVCAVVLARTEEPQFHLGLRRGDDAHEPVLHLAWHRFLLDQALADVIRRSDQLFPSAIVALPLDPAVSETLQALASRVAALYANRPAQPDSLAYGFGEPSATFDQATGQLTDPDAAFTCATFVLAMLRSVGVELLDAARWRAPTQEDIDWQRKIGDLLRDWIAKHIHGDLPRAQERFASDLRARRYRPTDVAAAALLGPEAWPAGADDVDPRAQELTAMLPWPG